MAGKKIDFVFTTLAERFTSVWKLLSDTTYFLSSLNNFPRYEQMLRKWRHRLENGRNNEEVVREVRQELVNFRAGMRKLGYDVRLGSFTIKLEGFRHDDAVAEGFKRLVLFITRERLYYLTGTANHNELDTLLEGQLLNVNTGRYIQKHYLWFKWFQKQLVLSGSASEPVESFEELKKLVKENKLWFMQNLKKLS